MSRQAVTTATFILLASSSGTGKAAPCELTSRVSDVPWNRLDTLLLAADSWGTPPEGSNLAPDAWGKVRDEAVAHVRSCDLPSTYPGKPDLPGYSTPYKRVFQDSGARVLDAVRDYERENNVAIPILTSALGLPGGPAPQPLQLGLSQVVAAGEPGFLAGVSVTPGIRSEGYFARHATIVASALVMNAPEPMGITGEPKFASGEVHFAFSSARTVWDFASDVTSHSQSATTDVEYDRRAWSAVRYLVGELRGALTAGVPDAVAVKNAVDAARRLYAASTKAYLTNSFVRPEAERDHVSQWGVSVVLRGSPNPELLPEIPDKYSAQLLISGTYRAVGNEQSLSIDGHAGISYSKDPVAGGDKDTVLVDASAGLAVILPSPSGPTRLIARGLFRYAPRNTIEMEKEVSAGVAVSLLVPIGSDIGISAAYAWRYKNGADDAATSSISIAKVIE